MKRHILVCGMLGGVLIALLKWSEYRLLVVDHAVDLYGALIAAVFAALGIALGLRFTRKAPAAMREAPAVTPVAAPVTAQPFTASERERSRLGITRRELEILELIARGLSNREIAGQLFVSENTVKTHCSRAFDKLGARRRTEAVQFGKQFGLLP